jgi:hypothetical protein
MERESLTGIKTVREIISGLDLARQKRPIKTTSSLRKKGKEIEPKISEKVLTIELEKEKRRFAKQDAALKRSRKKIRNTRQKLVNTKEKNRRLMEIRTGLQKKRWRRETPVRERKRVKTSGLKEMRLKY